MLLGTGTPGVVDKWVFVCFCVINDVSSCLARTCTGKWLLYGRMCKGLGEGRGDVDVSHSSSTDLCWWWWGQADVSEYRGSRVEVKE